MHLLFGLRQATGWQRKERAGGPASSLLITVFSYFLRRLHSVTNPSLRIGAQSLQRRRKSCALRAGWLLFANIPKVELL